MTVECNPDTVTPELAEAYAAGGVNRLSLGVQSMVAHVLRALGRTHDPANVRRAVTLVRAAGIATFNLDLIYGGAGETLDDWRRTLDDALELEPPHVSAYALTVEPGTPLADDPAPPSRRRRPGRQVPGGRRAPGGGGAALVRDLQLGPTRPRVPPQPALLVDGRVPGVRLRRPLAPGRPPVLERAHPRALHRRRSTPVGRPRPPASGSTPDERRLEALQLALRTRGGVPAAALPARGRRRPGGGRRATAPCSPCGAGCSPTRWRSVSDDAGRGASASGDDCTRVRNFPRHAVPPLRPGVGCRPARRRPPRLPRLRRAPARAARRPARR